MVSLYVSAPNKLKLSLASLGLLAALSSCGGESSTPSDSGNAGPSGGSPPIGSGGSSTGDGAAGTAGSSNPGAGAGGHGGGSGLPTGGSSGGVGGGAGTTGAAPGGTDNTESGGAAAGGSGTSSGGTGGGSGGGSTSAGCGAATWPKSDRYSIDVNGTTREYILDVPVDYSPQKPYRLIFAWHPLGGSAQQVANGGYYGLKSQAKGSAIFVSAEGLEQGWANTGGRDIAFLRAMLDRIQNELCIDQDRIFSTGFSYGGMMSFAIGCAMGDVFRAIAPMSGALYSGCENGSHPVAVWGAHGKDDQVVPLLQGEKGRDTFLQRNGCGTTTKPVEPSPCVSYDGCTEGYPVIWCQFEGEHTPFANSGQVIWNFFSQF